MLAQAEFVAPGQSLRIWGKSPGSWCRVMVPVWFHSLRQVLGCLWAQIPYLWNEECTGVLLVKLKPSDFREGVGEKWSSQLGWVVSLWVPLVGRVV